MELKLKEDNNAAAVAPGSNRTFMELKFRKVGVLD